MADNQNGRSLGTFHLARGIGMVLILLGHSITPFYLPAGFGQGIFSGAGSVLGGGLMVMFFLISGYGFFVRSPRKCISMQTQLLLDPYLYTMGAVLVTRLVLAWVMGRPFREHGGELVLTFLLGLNAEGGGTLWGVPVESVSILWFVLALYGGWIIYNGICQLEKPWLRDALALGCLALGTGLTWIGRVWPFCLPMVLQAVGLLAIGHRMGQKGWLRKKLVWWQWAVIGTLILISAAFGGVNMVACYWKLGILDMAGALCVGFVLLRLYRWWMDHNPGGVVIRGLETVGFYSVWVVFLHGYEKLIFPWHRLGGLLPGPVCVLVCLVARCVLIGLLFLALHTLRRLGKRKPKITLEEE